MVEVFRSRFFYLLGGFGAFLTVGKAQSGWAADNAALQLALDALQTIVLLPVEIAIYRLLILGEASSTAWASSPVRWRRMVGWTIVLWALMTLPKYLSDLTQSVAANIIATTVVVVVIIALWVRFAILFPAIAVDAPGASLGNVWADTRGRTWLILKTYLIVLLPLLAVVVVAGLISDRVNVPARLGTLGDSTFEFLANMALAVAAARLFDWIGHQVKGLPADSAQLAEQAPSVG
jgi:hypothetical protein